MKNLLICIKDNVQPERRGVESGINRTVSTSNTIASVFYVDLKGHGPEKSKKPVTAFRDKKGGVCFDVAHAPKKSVARRSLAVLCCRYTSQ